MFWIKYRELECFLWKMSINQEISESQSSFCKPTKQSAVSSTRRAKAGSRVRRSQLNTTVVNHDPGQRKPTCTPYFSMPADQSDVSVANEMRTGFHHLAGPVPLAGSSLERTAMDLMVSRLLYDPDEQRSYMEYADDDEVCLLDEDASRIVAVDTKPSFVSPVPGSTEGHTAFSNKVEEGTITSGSDVDSEYGDEAPSFNCHAIARGIPNDEEVTEDSVRVAIANLEIAMDEEQANLLYGQDKIFDWSDDYNTFWGQAADFSGPTPGPTVNVNSALEAFSLFWGVDIVQQIVTATNRQAKETIEKLKAADKFKASSRFRFWHDTNVEEVCLYFAVQILMGIEPRPSYKDYWTKCSLLDIPGFKKLMSYNKFTLMNTFMHFSNNDDYRDEKEGSKIFELKPVLDHLNEKFQSVYNLSREISLDESLTLSKEADSCNLCIISKTARFDIKSFEICDSNTGYLYKFFIYTGYGKKQMRPIESQGSDLGSSATQVVMGLLSGLERRGHLVTMDNFYNSPTLARYLKANGFDCLGPLRVNRKNVPIEIARLSRDVEKGTLLARHSGDVSVISWKDSKLVHMISTHHDSSTYVDLKAGKSMKPIAVLDYNNAMCGVDLKAQKLSMFLMERKGTLKWYMKMFRRLLNASILNSFIIFKCCNSSSTMTHRRFRFQLVEQLVRACKPGVINSVIPMANPGESRLRKDILHKPVKLSTRNKKRCVVCHKRKKYVRTSLQCGTCDRGLCYEPCWMIYHSEREF